MTRQPAVQRKRVIKEKRKLHVFLATIPLKNSLLVITELHIYKSAVLVNPLWHVSHVIYGDLAAAATRSLSLHGVL